MGGRLLRPCQTPRELSDSWGSRWLRYTIPQILPSPLQPPRPSRCGHEAIRPSLRALQSHRMLHHCQHVAHSTSMPQHERSQMCARKRICQVYHRPSTAHVRSDTLVTPVRSILTSCQSMSMHDLTRLSVWEHCPLLCDSTTTKVPGMTRIPRVPVLPYGASPRGNAPSTLPCTV